jgi:hypothetical protein
MHRDTDVTGASGTGVVADGVRLADGRAIVRWRGERSSVVFWARFDDAVVIHGHDGSTRFVEVGVVPEVERPGVLAAVEGAQLALSMVFAGPCGDLHPSGVECVQPAGHSCWPSVGFHAAAGGGEWCVDHG